VALTRLLDVVDVEWHTDSIRRSRWIIWNLARATTDLAVQIPSSNVSNPDALRRTLPHVPHLHTVHRYVGTICNLILDRNCFCFFP